MVVVASTGWLAHRFFWPVLRFGPRLAREVVGSAVPLGRVYRGLHGVHTNADFMLDVLHGPSAVGVYGVAQKLTEPLALIPAALMASTFPALSRRSPPDASGNQILTYSLKVLAVIGTGVLLAGVLFGPRVIVLLYGRPISWSWPGPAGSGGGSTPRVRQLRADARADCPQPTASQLHLQRCVSVKPRRVLDAWRAVRRRRRRDRRADQRGRPLRTVLVGDPQDS